MKKIMMALLIGGLAALGGVNEGTKQKERFGESSSMIELVPGSSWTGSGGWVGPDKLLGKEWNKTIVRVGPDELLGEEWNKTIVLRAIEAGDKGDWDEWEKEVAERFVLYGPRNRKPVSRKVCKANLVKQNKELKGGKRKILDVIAKENKVVVRMELTVMVKTRAYHIGKADEMVALRFPEISIYRIEGGQIVEQWVECDARGFADDFRGYYYGGWRRAWMRR